MSLPLRAWLFNRTVGSLRPGTMPWTWKLSGICRNFLETFVSVVLSEAVYFLASDYAEETRAGALPFFPKPSWGTFFGCDSGCYRAALVADGCLSLPWMACLVPSSVSFLFCCIPLLLHFFIPLLATKILSGWKTEKYLSLKFLIQSLWKNNTNKIKNEFAELISGEHILLGHILDFNGEISIFCYYGLWPQCWDAWWEGGGRAQEVSMERLSWNLKVK